MDNEKERGKEGRDSFFLRKQKAEKILVKEAHEYLITHKESSLICKSGKVWW